LFWGRPTLRKYERDAEVFTADVVTVMPGAPEMHGLEAFEAMGEAFHRAFPDGRFSIRSTVESGTRSSSREATRARTPASS
jgi:predicted ester cyclase